MLLQSLDQLMRSKRENLQLVIFPVVAITAKQQVGCPLQKVGGEEHSSDNEGGGHWHFTTIDQTCTTIDQQTNR